MKTIECNKPWKKHIMVSQFENDPVEILSNDLLYKSLDGTTIKYKVGPNLKILLEEAYQQGWLNARIQSFEAVERIQYKRNRKK